MWACKLHVDCKYLINYNMLKATMFADLYVS